MIGDDSDDVWCNCRAVVSAAMPDATAKAMMSPIRARRSAMRLPSEVVYFAGEEEIFPSIEGEISPSSQSCSCAKAIHACAMRQ